MKNDRQMQRMERNLKGMWQDDRVQLYQNSVLPDDKAPSVFLAGPTSRNQILEFNWRCEAVRLLRKNKFEGWIFCPEYRGQDNPGDFTESSYNHKWESDRLMCATHVAFWIPRNSHELLGLNTNLELGIFLGRKSENNLRGQHLFVGWPHTAQRMGLPDHYLKMFNVRHYDKLNDICKEISLIQPGYVFEK